MLSASPWRYPVAALTTVGALPPACSTPAAQSSSGPLRLPPTRHSLPTASNRESINFNGLAPPTALIPQVNPTRKQESHFATRGALAPTPFKKTIPHLHPSDGANPPAPLPFALPFPVLLPQAKNDRSVTLTRHSLLRISR